MFTRTWETLVLKAFFPNRVLWCEFIKILFLTQFLKPDKLQQRDSALFIFCVFSHCVWLFKRIRRQQNSSGVLLQVSFKYPEKMFQCISHLGKKRRNLEDQRGLAAVGRLLKWEKRQKNQRKFVLGDLESHFVSHHLLLTRLINVFCGAHVSPRVAMKHYSGLRRSSDVVPGWHHEEIPTVGRECNCMILCLWKLVWLLNQWKKACVRMCGCIRAPFQCFGLFKV